MKPYYQDEWGKQYCSDALKVLSELEGDSLDLLATDPPYGISFMGKDWDRALPDIEIWRQCFRVLKAGSFAFVMSIPRADCLSRMIISLEDAGFLVNFTPIFWAYASGFPKAQNIGKAVDKRLGVERDKGDIRNDGRGKWELKMNREQGDTGIGHADGSKQIYQEDFATSPQAKALDGSYGGFQPKPAVEVIIVAMKPLSEKTFVDQALKNQKGITWLDDGRIPYESEGEPRKFENEKRIKNPEYEVNHGESIFVGGTKSNYSDEMGKMFTSGRFPANLLVSDDVLDDGRERKVGNLSPGMGKGYHIDKGTSFGTGCNPLKEYGGDSGSFSRYFDLDKWWAKTFPFLIVPKASKSEKNKLVDGIESDIGHNRFDQCANCGGYILQNPDRPSACKCETPVRKHNKLKGNVHPTVKPLKLMSYLITLGSREGDTVLDPFMGSGTTALASKLLGRKCIGIEIEEKYCEISANRCRQMVFDFKGGRE